MAAVLESAGGDTLKLLKEHVPGLAVVVEQVGHLLDVSVAVEATEKAKDKKRVATAAESNDDRRAKIGKVECGGFKDNVSISAAGVACFYSVVLAVSALTLLSSQSYQFVLDDIMKTWIVACLVIRHSEFKLRAEQSLTEGT
ncbi:hypothetical protein HU200_011516 [Digitaria exilis]|uniref:Uncharacterized protein n=1 Tax=Digitaria exilis TaxID=1010633 RepID=A0A835FHR1_9POAL|nr:hypothetical protein HU200_011516 [Digitaria exilis]